MSAEARPPTMEEYQKWLNTFMPVTPESPENLPYTKSLEDGQWVLRDAKGRVKAILGYQDNAAIEKHLVT